jgi:large conductance mechanosensitive channel
MSDTKPRKKVTQALAESSYSFWSEFKSFAIKGNMVDLAVGIMIGTAFNRLVQSLVEDIIMPPIGAIAGDTDFSNLYINLSSRSYESLEAAQAAGAPVLRYGIFINNMLDFMILALTIFVVLKYVLRLKKEEAAKEGK